MTGQVYPPGSIPEMRKFNPTNTALKPGLLRNNFRRKDFMRKVTMKNKLIWGFRNRCRTPGKPEPGLPHNSDQGSQYASAGSRAKIL
jgi:hypothetical protein